MDALFDTDQGLPNEMQLGIMGRLEGAWFVRLMRLAQAHHNVLVRRRGAALTPATKRSIRTLKTLINIIHANSSKYNTRMVDLALSANGQLQTPMRLVLEHHEKSLAWFAANPNATAIQANPVSRLRPPSWRAFSTAWTLADMLTIYRALTMVSGLDIDPDESITSRFASAVRYMVTTLGKTSDLAAFLDTFAWLVACATLGDTMGNGENYVLPRDARRVDAWMTLLQALIDVAVVHGLPRTFAVCLEQLGRIRSPPDNATAAQDLRFVVGTTLTRKTFFKALRRAPRQVPVQSRKAWDAHMTEIIRTWANTDVVELVPSVDDFFKNLDPTVVPAIDRESSLISFPDLLPVNATSERTRELPRLL